MHHPQAARIHSFHQRLRNGRSAAEDETDVRQFAIRDFLQHADPDRRHAAEPRRFLALREIDHRFRIARPAIGKNERGAGHAGRIRNAPRVRMKHRHDWQDDIRFADGHRAALKECHGVKE